MKKWLSILLVLALALGLCACGGTSQPAGTAGDAGNEEAIIAADDHLDAKTVEEAEASPEEEKQVPAGPPEIIWKNLLTREYSIGDNDMRYHFFPQLTLHIYDEHGVETGQETKIDFSGIPWHFYDVPNGYLADRDENGELVRLEYLYDNDGRGTPCHTVYDLEDGHVVQRYTYYPEYDTDTRDSRYTVYVYDEEGRCTETHEVSGEDYTDRCFDENGCLIRFESHVRVGNEDHLTQYAYTYDENANMLSLEETEKTIENPGTEDETVSYEVKRSGMFTYDANGNELTAETTDYHGKTVQASFRYDDQNNLVEALWKEDGKEHGAEYLYDEDGNLTEMRRTVNGAPQDTTRFQYTLKRDMKDSQLNVEMTGNGLELPYGVKLSGIWREITYSDGSLYKRSACRLRPAGRLMNVYENSYNFGPGTEVNFFDEPDAFYVYETIACIAPEGAEYAPSPYTSVEELLPTLQESYGGNPIPEAEEGWRLKTAWNRSAGDSHLCVRTDVLYDENGEASFRSRWSGNDIYGRSGITVNYDDEGRLVEGEFQTGRDYFERIRYSEDGGLCGISTASSGQPYRRQENYDLRGRLIEILNFDENGETTAVTTCSYDDKGVLSERKTLYTGGSETEATILYDDAGRVISVETPDWVIATYEYDEAGRISRSTDSNGQRDMRYTYDADGLKTGEAFASGYTNDTQYTYETDEEGFLRAVGPTDTSTRSLEFDGHGNLTRYLMYNGPYVIFWDFEWEKS